MEKVDAPQCPKMIHRPVAVSTAGACTHPRTHTGRVADGDAGAQ